MRRISTGMLVVFFALGAGLFFLRPPGEPGAADVGKGEKKDIAYPLDTGQLPGVTWVDDIHPIFLRNRCGDCHTRGNEAAVDSLKDFTLGLVDPDDANNPFYSYHELVYAEGEPVFLEDENLRRGQCCWPKEYPVDQQRRIWLGRPERSALVRKLERDYFDWNIPPRYLEEGLDMPWGAPMPWSTSAEGHEDETGAHAMDEDDGQGHDDPAEHHDTAGPVDDDSHAHEAVVTRTAAERMWLHLRLWLGQGREDLHAVPPRIPVADRMILRYWIEHARQLGKEGAGFRVKVVDEHGRPMDGAVVEYVGNYNSPGRMNIEDVITLTTDESGVAEIVFGPYSVVSSPWNLSSKRNGLRSAYSMVGVIDGTVRDVSLTISSHADDLRRVHREAVPREEEHGH